MSNTIAIIPARSGSKGLPDKNIKELAGKPLIAYSIVAAQKTNLIDRIIVSTDSNKISNLSSPDTGIMFAFTLTVGT